jgi:hypothetical protein
MNNDEQRGTAYHEASHAVIATLLGGTLGNVAIKYEGGTWEGDAQVTWSEGAGPARKQKRFQGAVAGPLGQAKYRACLNWNGATFDKNYCLLDVIRIVREGEPEEPSRLSFGFVASDGSKHILEIKDPNDIGDLETLQCIVNEFDDENLLQLLEMVQDHLDSQAVWAAIGDIAESLCRQQAIAGQEAVAIIEKHGLIGKNRPYSVSSVMHGLLP